MSRYPRSARTASVKCIRCNAPAARTIEDVYVCVECGSTPVTGNRSKLADSTTDDD